MIEKCEEHNINDIQIGQSKKFTIVISESMIDKFAELSGDYNPLHMDENYAQTTKFTHRICHGMLLSSLFSKLVGMHIPGKNALYFSQSLKFLLPCFIDEKITVEGKVLNKSTSTGIITIKTTVKNESKKILVDGEAKVLVRNN